MNYAIRQRQVMIDFLLAHYGYINREALVDFYGLSMAQASQDLKTYREATPNNMRYDTSSKCWTRTGAFKRVFTGESTNG